MRDTGRSPLHLLLDGRTSRDRAHGSDRRRRACHPARQPRTPRARKIKAALERRGVTASRRRIGNIMREQGMTSAYARRRFKPHKTRADEARLANLLDRGSDGYAPHTHLAGGLTYVRVGGGRAYVCLLVDLANRGIAGHSVGRTRDAGLVLGAFATLDFPLTDVQVFHTDRGSEFDNTRIDELLDVFGIKRSLSRKGNPYDNAVVESTNRLLRKELIYRNPVRHNRAVETRPRRLRVLVRRPEAPLHPRIPEPEGIHRTRTRPLRNCPTHRCQSTRSGCTSPWATHRKRWKPSIMRTKRRKPPRYKGGTKIRPYQFVGARRCD